MWYFCSNFIAFVPILLSGLRLSDGISGKHSPRHDAFDALIYDVKAPADKARPSEVSLPPSGDIFDIFRSTKWFGIMAQSKVSLS